MINVKTGNYVILTLVTSEHCLCKNAKSTTSIVKYNLHKTRKILKR